MIEFNCPVCKEKCCDEALRTILHACEDEHHKRGDFCPNAEPYFCCLSCGKDCECNPVKGKKWFKPLSESIETAEAFELHVREKEKTN